MPYIVEVYTDSQREQKKLMEDSTKSLLRMTDLKKNLWENVLWWLLRIVNLDAAPTLEAQQLSALEQHRNRNN